MILGSGNDGSENILKTRLQGLLLQNYKEKNNEAFNRDFRNAG
jgi:hypothetical protein